MGIVFTAVVALFIGWATPQPAFAKTFTDWLVTKAKDIGK